MSFPFCFLFYAGELLFDFIFSNVPSFILLAFLQMGSDVGSGMIISQADTGCWEAAISVGCR